MTMRSEPTPAVARLIGCVACLWPVSTLVAGDARAERPGVEDAPVAEQVLALGRTLFAHQWVPADARSHGGDGLGPVYNERSCLGCHNQGGPGGGAGGDQNITIVTAAGVGDTFSSTPFTYGFRMNFGPNGFEYRMASNPVANPPARLNRADLVQIHQGFRDAPSVVLHRFGPDADYRTWRESVPGQHGAIVVRSSQRNPPPLFGAGLIDAIPDAVIEAAARRRFGGFPAVQGRVNRLPDGRIGRFGWKAQTATLREFVVSAAAGELGLEVPGRPQAADPRTPPLAAPGLDMTQDECDALVAYVASLPAPRATDQPDRAARAGASLFRSLGCAHCHQPRLGDVMGIYSDLLIHDMSAQLGDTGFYGVFATRDADAPLRARPAADRRGGAPARLQEWRTPPLWGLRDSAPYLHDGRADTIEQAILLHGGEASASAQRFEQLSSREKAQLEAFLLTLAAPRPQP